MSTDFDTLTLGAIAPLREAGFALHWLKPRDKAPAGGAGWSEAPVASLDALGRAHRPGYNLGVRLGEPSRLIGGLYLHVIDLDIRFGDLADEAWTAFRKLLDGVDLDMLPTVKSGSGGESRHLFFAASKPFFSKVLAHSEGKHRRFDSRVGREVWSYDWEIELFGTGKQVALPPSVHPSGNAYEWLRPFDLDALAFGAAPEIPADAIERLAVAETAAYEFESRPPLDFKPGQMERDLDLLPAARLDDYHDWVTLGQALHHQFGGSEEGFDLWVTQSKRSEKFDSTPQGLRDMRRKWRGFGKNRRQPVTMATVRQWAQEARLDALAGEFDDLDDLDRFDEDLNDDDETDEFGDLLGAAAPVDALAAFDLTPEEKAAAKVQNWASLLDVNEEGGFRPTLHNVELIVRNDPRLIGLPQMNRFTQETVQRTPPGTKTNRRRNAAKDTRQLSGPIWEVADRLNGEIWSSARDHAVRSIIEAPRTQGGYGMQVTDRNLKAATVLAAWDSAFHPVQEYLERLRWDGAQRVERLFIDYLAAEDNAYSRQVARLMMIAAVSRIFEPGHKFDFAVILEGIQGKRKTTFIEVLGRHWFAELDGNFHDPKEMVEKMQGAWIMEIPELSAFNRSDVQSIKAFISRKTDKVRLAYEARAALFPRQCIFIGSTNDSEYLKDPTGGRRFWPMPCWLPNIDTAALEANIDNLWAEALILYREMRAAQPFGTLPLYLTNPEAQTIAARLQESRRVETPDDALAGQISAWLARPVSSGNAIEDGEAPRFRTETCLIEIWMECMGGSKTGYTVPVSQSIGRAMKLVPGWEQTGTPHTFPQPYGRQRCYALGGRDGYHKRLVEAFDGSS